MINENIITLKDFQALTKDWPVSKRFTHCMRRAIVAGESIVSIKSLSNTERRWCRINGFQTEQKTKHIEINI